MQLDRGEREREVGDDDEEEETASLRVSSCLSQGLGFLSLLMVFRKALLVLA